MRKLSAKAIAAGLTIEKRVVGYAYPRNGNTHNPTPRVLWLLRVADGRIVDSARRLRDILETADDIADEHGNAR